MLFFAVFLIPWLVYRAINGTIRAIQRSFCHPDVKGKVVVITGASSGLGKECAKCFAAAGAKVILCSRNEAELLKVKNEIVASSSKQMESEPTVIKLDLEDLEGIQNTAKQILDVFGHVDVLINNAGISYRGTIMETSLETHKRIMVVNYFGPLELTRALLPSMLKNNCGHIVAVSSVQGKLSVPFRSAYSASKHAFQAFFDCLRSEVAEHSIKVTSISPGYISTNLSKNALTGDGEKYGVIDETTSSGMPPAVVAQRILEAVEMSDQDVIIADFKATVAIYLRTLLPGILFWSLKKRARSKIGHKVKAS